jgi:hypothetical protein
MKTIEKKIFSFSKNGYTLRSNEGSINTRWYISYIVEYRGQNVHRKLYGGINRGKTAEDRYKLAIDYINTLSGANLPHLEDTSRIEGQLNEVLKKTLRRT